MKHTNRSLFFTMFTIYVTLCVLKFEDPEDAVFLGCLELVYIDGRLLVLYTVCLNGVRALLCFFFSLFLRWQRMSVEFNVPYALYCKLVMLAVHFFELSIEAGPMCLLSKHMQL